MMQIKLIPASEGDISTISDLAKTIWNQYYPEIISQEQIDYMLEKMYSAESLKEQLTKKGHLFYFIRYDKHNLGFISVHRESEYNWFINKFYLDQRQAQKGMGTAAFDELLKIIPAEKISLTVNRQNYKSINFYFKNGFKIDRVADFDIGNGFVMNDFVMVWERRH